MNTWATKYLAKIRSDRLHQHLLPLAAACFMCILMSPASSAQDAKPAQTPVVASAAPADLGYGDYVHLNEPTAFSRVNPADLNQAGTTVCLKPHAKLQFVRALTSTGGDRPGTSVLEFKRKVRHTLKRSANDLLNVDCSSPQGVNLGAPETDLMVYRVDQDKLPKEYYKHMGITHGALFVPFKRRPDKSLSGETSLGYFFGYRFDTLFGITVTPIATAGMSLVNVSNDSIITPTSTLQDSGVRAAFTYGAGLIFTHLGSFQVGAVYGWDKIGGDAGKAWKYEGKGWSSLMVGYAFTR